MPDTFHAQTDKPIFISYSRADTVFARQLYEALHGLGFALWRDRSEMEGGQNWWQQIQEAIEKSDTMVLCMSPAALASPVVTQEWRYARQVGTRVIPVVAANVDFQTVPRWMKKFDWPDFRPGAPEHDLIWPKFVHQLNTTYERQRLPFTVPDLPSQFVQRPAELSSLIRLLLDETRENPVAITTALQGGGGFGKTTLALAICHEDDVINAFSDGILWITLGESPNLIALVMDQIEVLTGERPGLSDLNAASRRLGELLEDRDVLMVLDDVWDEGHARAFMQGGQSCARLITTRRKDITARLEARGMEVNEMTTDEGAHLLIAWLDSPPPLEPFRALARDLGEWPLLLALAGGYLRDAVTVDGESLEDALTGLRKRLEKRGFTAFDRTDEGQRDRAISASLDVSLERLGRWYARYLELAIFPGDTAVPWQTLDRLWKTTAGLDEIDCEDARKAMQRLSLFTRYDVTARTVRLHDVVRAYVREAVSASQGGLQALNIAFLDSYAVTAWADLPPKEPYLWDHLAYHLVEAGRETDLRATVIDLCYLAAKTYARDAFAAESDFATAEKTHANTDQVKVFRRHFTNAGHLLNAAKNDGALAQASIAATLLSRLTHLPERAQDCQTFEQSIPRPYLNSYHPLPDLPHPALVRTLVGHTGPVNGCVWFEREDGEFIVSASSDQVLRVWNARSGQLQRALAGHTKRVRGCAVSPGGEFIVSVSEDYTLIVWDARTGQIRNHLGGHTNTVRGCAVSPDGEWIVSASDDRTLRTWNARTGQVQFVLTGHTGEVNACAVSPDGEWIVSASDDRTLRIWNSRTGKFERLLAGHGSEVNDCLWFQHPDGDLIVSASGDHTLRIWDVNTGQTRHILTGHIRGVRGCAVSPNGEWIASASWDRTVRVWNTQTGQTRLILAGHTGPVRGCAVSPGGDYVASACWDGALRVWDIQPDAGLDSAFREQDGHTSEVRGCAVSRDGQLFVSASADRTLRVWEAHTGRLKAVLSGHTGPVRGCAVSPDKTFLVSASYDGTLRIWDTLTGQTRLVLTGHERGVRACAISPDNTWIVSSSDDHTLRVWETDTWQIRLTLEGHTRPVRSCAISPDGKLIVSASYDGTVRTWEAQTGQPRSVLKGHLRGVSHCEIDPKGQFIVSSSDDTTLRVWDLKTGHVRLALEGHTRPVESCAISSDGVWIASVSWDGRVRVWEAQTGRCRAVLHVDGPVLSCTWIPGSLDLVAGGSRGLYWLRLVEE